MKASLLILVLAACGSDSGSKMDAPAGGGSDAKVYMDAPSGQLADCTSYCTAITTNCTAANLQYASMATCMASCSHLPVGTMATQSGDNLQCRAYHAMAAAADANTHCVHAGPSGAGICGTPCMGFCDLAVAECPAVYANAGACSTACANFATTPAYTANVTSGNSLSCRIYHATAASTDPGLHCPHTGTVSATCQ